MTVTMRSSLIAFTMAAAFGQSPSFEVASIKMYPDGTSVPSAQQLSPTGITMRGLKFVHLIQFAYDIRKVTGPNWIYAQRYDIVAKAAAPVPTAQLKRMFQTLLADRFKLKLHRETQESIVLALIQGRDGAKNLPAAPGMSAIDWSVEAGDPPHTQLVDGVLVSKNVPMSHFALMLANRPPAGVNELVVDKTGLKGVYTIAVSVKEFNLNDPSFAGNYGEQNRAFLDFFSAALQKQYGLKLERRKLPLDALVVDGASMVPTDN